ncbi:MAG: twin-arginine translocase subunit TatB [Sphingomonadales bacterium]|nr:MAG: twin-arginine translocase subunit TatB [Sphingomonadales bacterium]
MFDIGASELLVIVIVAILVIGPKDMPLALRTAGRWIGKVRRVSGHFRAGVDAMIREAELEEMEKKWQAQNEAIMARTTDGPATEGDLMSGPPASSAESAALEPGNPSEAEANGKGDA